MTDAMMEGLVGHCINAIASMFAPLPELNALPSDCFSCVVRAARDMEASKVWGTRGSGLVRCAMG